MPTASSAIFYLINFCIFLWYIFYFGCYFSKRNSAISVIINTK